MQQNHVIIFEDSQQQYILYVSVCPFKATMACTVRRSTMSVCLRPVRTTPPVGILSMPMSVSAPHSLKVCE